MFVPKVREQISNLKPGTLGYKTAWERLQGEYPYGRNSKFDSNEREQLRKRVRILWTVKQKFDALHTLEEADMLKGFVMTTLKKLPQVKPDLVRVDDKW